VTGAAAGDVHYAAHLILLHQCCAQRGLIRIGLAVHRNWIRAARLLVFHVEDLIARAEVLLRSTMASEAPFHLQRFLLVHQRHLIDRAVARVAADTLGHVNAVVKENEVGERVDARPLQRFARAIAGADGLKQLGVRPDLRMAVHTGLRRRNPGETGGFDRCMAVAAVDAESGDVMLMAERNRLRLADAGRSHIRRALDDVEGPTQSCNDENRAENRGARQTIRTAMKDL